MPLKVGSSNSVIRGNYKKLKKEGYPENQAWAIAFEKAKRKRKRKAKG